MTQCNPCNIMKPLARCMGILTLGVTTNPGGSFFVYIRNNTTEVLTQLEGIVNLSNEVTVDLSAYPQIEGHDYEIWATLQSATNPDERETLTINSIDYTCFAVHFITIKDIDGVMVTGLDQTLEAV